MLFASGHDHQVCGFQEHRNSVSLYSSFNGLNTGPVLDRSTVYDALPIHLLPRLHSCPIFLASLSLAAALIKITHSSFLAPKTHAHFASSFSLWLWLLWLLPASCSCPAQELSAVSLQWLLLHSSREGEKQCHVLEDFISNQDCLEVYWAALDGELEGFLIPSSQMEYRLTK